jgi:hypothetical protein
MALGIGDRVDDWSFARPDGSAVCLSEFTAPALLLVLLRHLG